MGHGEVPDSAPRRRIRLTIEAESTIVIDEQKFEEHFIRGPQTIKTQQSAIEGMVNGSDFLSRDDIARLLGTTDGYIKDAETLVTAEIEEQCPEHPEVWFALDPTRLARCWMCGSEKRAKVKS